MKGSVQEQHNRDYAVFGPVRDFGIAYLAVIYFLYKYGGDFRYINGR